ncbi:general transcription factor II-I repeat domain-containing protein 2A [Trichonephila clavipes]|nr:general transcription factor II-I repeat domain-containing protein 2A [Trichonephila clavipes]
MPQDTNKKIIFKRDLNVFDSKKHVFRNDIITRNYKYFPNLKKPDEEKVIEELISIIIMYPDVTSFDKLNLFQFHWLEIEEFEMQLRDFKPSSIWIQKFIETRIKLEFIETEKLTRIVLAPVGENSLYSLLRANCCNLFCKQFENCSHPIWLGSVSLSKNCQTYSAFSYFSQYLVCRAEVVESL